MATVTEKGLEAIARNLAGVSPLSSFIYISTGSGTTLGEDESNTALETEHTGGGLGRAAATCEYMGSNTIRWSHTYTATAGATITEVGIFNNANAGAGDMFLRHVIPALTVNIGTEVEVSITHTMY